MYDSHVAECCRADRSHPPEGHPVRPSWHGLPARGVKATGKMPVPRDREVEARPEATPGRMYEQPRDRGSSGALRAPAAARACAPVLAEHPTPRLRGSSILLLKIRRTFPKKPIDLPGLGSIIRPAGNRRASRGVTGSVAWGFERCNEAPRDRSQRRDTGDDDLRQAYRGQSPQLPAAPPARARSLARPHHASMLSLMA